MNVELNLFVMYLCNVSVWSCDIHDAFGTRRVDRGLRERQGKYWWSKRVVQPGWREERKTAKAKMVGEMNAWMHGRSEEVLRRRRTFDFDDALLAIHGRMSVCGGAWHVFLRLPLGHGH